MDFSKGLIYSASEFEKSSHFSDLKEIGNYRHEFLEWAANFAPLKLSVFENKSIFNGDTFYRYSVEGLISDGAKFAGFGRNKDQTTAAVIGVMEVLERFVARQIFTDNSLQSSLQPSMAIVINKGEFHFSEARASGQGTTLPSKGFRTSNGWALHFNAQTAAHNAGREALERHILLSTYLEHGWEGFQFSEPVKFEKRILRPTTACVTAGGFSAGMVLTTGHEAPGATFGYLCDQTINFNESPRWLGAFHESFDQWVDLTSAKKPQPVGAQPLSPLELAQWHYLEAPTPDFEVGERPTRQQAETLCGNILLLDLQKVFLTPFPLFAAFVYGGDLLPLAFKAKLNSTELQFFENQLRRLLGNLQGHAEINKSLPEVHPIL